MAKFICKKSRECKEKYGQTENTKDCPHIKPHGYNIECDEELKKSYGWRKIIGCYYFPDAECIGIK